VFDFLHLGLGKSLFGKDGFGCFQDLVFLERIGRLKEKYGVGSLYDIDVKQEKGVATNIIFNINPNGKAK